jgi:hypothetical protein
MTLSLKPGTNRDLRKETKLYAHTPINSKKHYASHLFFSLGLFEYEF